MPDEANKLRVVIVSGLSGAGKTVALRALEDAGFFCIDNLPVKLIASFLTAIDSRNIRNVGIGVDIREKTFLGDAYRIIALLKEHYGVEIIFLEAEKEVMIRRFKETRRPHPMIVTGTVTGIEDAIEEEKKQLTVLRDSADKILDTSNYTPHQLRQMIMSAYSRAEVSKGLNITLISFGYKYGIPQSSDLLFDIRFLPNPYFVPSLKPLTGLDEGVAAYVMSNADAVDLLSRLDNLLGFLLPRYIKEGRAYLVIGVGCTGGRHRSPVLVQELAKRIKDNYRIESNIVHRDIGQ
jgi:UPF0042 nucleotide-binding protein